MRPGRIGPRTMDLHRVVANLAGFFAPLAIFVIVRRLAPIFVHSQRTAAMLARFFVPLGCPGRNAFLVGFGRVIPTAVDAH